MAPLLHTVVFIREGKPSPDSSLTSAGQNEVAGPVPAQNGCVGSVSSEADSEVTFLWGDLLLRSCSQHSWGGGGEASQGRGGFRLGPGLGLVPQGAVGPGGPALGQASVPVPAGAARQLCQGMSSQAGT